MFKVLEGFAGCCMVLDGFAGLDGCDSGCDTCSRFSRVLAGFGGLLSLVGFWGVLPVCLPVTQAVTRVQGFGGFCRVWEGFGWFWTHWSLTL